MKSLKDGCVMVQPHAWHITSGDMWKLTLACPTPHAPISQIRKPRDRGFAQEHAAEGGQRPE